MKPEVRTMLGLIGVLLLLSGGLLLLLPVVNVWPHVLLFWSVGLGLVVGAVMSSNAEHATHDN